MKKFLTILVVTLGFTITGAAQSKTTVKLSSPEEKAKMDSAVLMEALENNTASFYDAVYQLFLKKHTLLNKKEVTVNERSEVRALIEGKLRASFTADEIKKLQDKGLWEGLLQ